MTATSQSTRRRTELVQPANAASPSIVKRSGRPSRRPARTRMATSWSGRSRRSAVRPSSHHTHRLARSTVEDAIARFADPRAQPDEPGLHGARPRARGIGMSPRREVAANTTTGRSRFIAGTGEQDQQSFCQSGLLLNARGMSAGSLGSGVGDVLAARDRLELRAAIEIVFRVLAEHLHEPAERKPGDHVFGARSRVQDEPPAAEADGRDRIPIENLSTLHAAHASRR